MKVTPDRLAVARAVLLDCIERWDLPREIINDMGDEESDLRDVIAAIPEPPDDSPATLPAPTGPGWWWIQTIKGHWHIREIKDGMVAWVGGRLCEVDEIYPRWVGARWVGPLVAPTAKGGAE